MKKIILLVISILISMHTTQINTGTAAERPIEFKLIKNNANKEKVDTNLLNTTTDLRNLHTATWYDLTGRKTASGDRFHRDSMTAAYNYSKLGKLLLITNVENDKFIIIKVTDRMGYKGKNHIDLSKGAFDSIGDLSSGRIRVVVEELK